MSLEFYFAKLIINKSLFTSDIPKLDLLMNGFTGGRSIQIRNKKFLFAEVDSFQIDGRNFIYGIIAKYDDVGEEVINESTRKIGEQIVEDKIIAKVRFIIDLEDNIILYTEVINHIGKNSFPQIFSDLLSAALSEQGVTIEVNPISETYSFYDRLKSLAKIKVLKLAIVPTNPNPADIIKKMDDKLKAQAVKRKTITYKAKEQGLNLDDEEIKTESMYTDFGYGVGYGVGEDASGKTVKVYSQKSDKQRKTKPLSLDGGVMKLISDIKDLLGG